MNGTKHAVPPKPGAKGTGTQHNFTIFAAKPTGFPTRLTTRRNGFPASFAAVNGPRSHHRTLLGSHSIPSRTSFGTGLADAGGQALIRTEQAEHAAGDGSGLWVWAGHTR